jgi:A/G-specific adenine glycosylase
LLNLDADPKAGSTQKKLWQVATDWLPKGHARNFNQGLMELGATVCHVQQPSCLLCPIQPHCQAYVHQTTEMIPRRTQRKAPIPVTKAVLVLVCENQVLLRRPEQGLMQGLWAFPETLVKEEEPLVELQAEWQRRNRPDFQLQTNWPTLTHAYTTFLATLHPFYCTLTSIHADFPLEAEEQWHPLQRLPKLAMANAHGRLRQSLLNQN